VITEGKLQKAVHHVVHDYANLVSSGTMAVQGSHLGKGFDPPVNTHIDHAFLANCRKLYEFFTFKPKNGSVRAKDFLPNRPCELSNWGSWHRHMNEQLMHVTIARVENRKEWKGIRRTNSSWKSSCMHGRNVFDIWRSRTDQCSTAKSSRGSIQSSKDWIWDWSENENDRGGRGCVTVDGASALR